MIRKHTPSNIVRTALMLCALSLLGGCYESNTQVLVLGQQTPLSGTYDCVSTDGSEQPQTISISQASSDQGDGIAYVYKIANGGNLQFYELASGRYLAQAARSYKHWGRGEKDARFAYFFADIQSRSLFNVYVADFSSNPDQLKKQLQSRSLSFKSNPASSLPTVTLTGDADALFEFFDGHSNYMMRQTVSCRQS